jgi:transcriptional regulator with XRE-family HTH domain
MSEKETLSKLGAKIRMIRTNKNITQADLADKCHFEKASMSRIESGKINITISTLFKISNALEVDVSGLLKD